MTPRVRPSWSARKSSLILGRFSFGADLARSKYTASTLRTGLLSQRNQGVKGREFPRVMVVIDDDAARGFMFSYDKLFGLKAKSKTDLKNEAEGKETGVDRARRLFYVTCTRAESGLAIVAYSSDPNALRATVVEFGWFEEGEVVVLD